MSITILCDDKSLSRILFLEAKRQGFHENRDPSVIFVDLDRYVPPKGISEKTPIIGLSHSPARLSDARKKSVFTTLSLPFSVRELEIALDSFPVRQAAPAIRREDNRLLLGGKVISLSATESALFDLLYENRHRTVSDEELKAVLGESAEHTNTLAVYLYRLRRKLCADGVSRIRTLRGQGYQWIEESR